MYIYSQSGEQELESGFSLRVKTCLIEINHNIIFLKVKLLNVSEEYNHWLSIFTGLDTPQIVRSDQQGVENLIYTKSFSI